MLRVSEVGKINCTQDSSQVYHYYGPFLSWVWIPFCNLLNSTHHKNSCTQFKYLSSPTVIGIRAPPARVSKRRDQGLPEPIIGCLTLGQDHTGTVVFKRHTSQSLCHRLGLGHYRWVRGWICCRFVVVSVMGGTHPRHTHTLDCIHFQVNVTVPGFLECIVYWSLRECVWSQTWCIKYFLYSSIWLGVIHTHWLILWHTNPDYLSGVETNPTHVTL